MRRIKTKLIFWFLFMSLVPLLAGFTFNYYERIKNLRSESIQKLVAVRDLKVQQVQTWIDNQVRELNSLATDHEITHMDFVRGVYSHDKEAIPSLLREHVRQSDEYIVISIADANTGIVSASTRKTMIGENIANTDYFRKAINSQEVFIKDIFRSKETGEPRMIFSRAIHNGDHVRGVVYINTGVSNTLYKLLSNRIGLGKTGETLIVNKDVFAINTLRWTNEPPLQLKINAEPAVNSSKGITGYGESVDYRGKKILTAYTYIPETSWGFVAKQDLEELLQPVYETIIATFSLFVLLLIFIIMLTYMLTKKIADPIREMAENTRKIEEGNYSVRNTVNTNDELSILAGSMNAMASAIESRVIIRESVEKLLRKIIESKDIYQFTDSTIGELMDITDANLGAFYILNQEHNQFEAVSAIGLHLDQLKTFSASKFEGEFGKVLFSQKIVHSRIVSSESQFIFQTVAGDVVPREIITFPIVIKGQTQAIISLGTLSKFSENSIQIIEQSNLNITTIFFNRRRGHRLQELNEELQNYNTELEIQKQELARQADELELQNSELEQQKKEIKEANKLKSEFLSNMSHELRTPLNSIIALSKVLLMKTQERLSGEEYNYLKIVSRNGKELLGLINDILDLSKIEAGKVNYHIQKFPLHSLIRNIEDKLISIIDKKDIRFISNYEEVLPTIESDKAKLMHVFQNILSNAAKFTHEGSIKVLVKLSSCHKHFVITIEDTGIGIPEHELPRIFDEFKQVDGSTSREYEGTGLGLAIAHKTLEMVDGTVFVESEPGRGTCFTIKLPVEWQGEKVVDAMPEPESIITPVEVKSQPMVGDNRILIVEDNPHTVTQIKYVLEKEGFIIDIATGGQEAIDYLGHTIPNGIILDLMMPGIDGFEVLETLRGITITKDTPVLILTAKDLTYEDIKKLSDNNIQQLIFKGDVDQDELLFKIKGMMGLKVTPPPPVDLEHSSSETLSKVKIKDKKPSLLIVEDNQDNITTLKAVLQNNYRLYEANDGIVGIQKAIEEMPDLILLDIGLPKKDGIQVATELKSSITTRNIPIIALTAHAMKEDKERILNAGCDDYITKPLDPIALLEKLSNWWEN